MVGNYSHIISKTRIRSFYAFNTSSLEGNTIKPITKIIECSEIFAKANEVNDIVNIWNKQFEDNGLFEKGELPYNFKPRILRVSDLETLKEEDSGKIFHGFMEILRHNVVSDQPNAFNKIFNLFLCKLYDEKRKNKRS